MSLDEMIDCYEGDPNRMGKIELAAVTLLKVSDEVESDILQKSKLRQAIIFSPFILTELLFIQYRIYN